jgi:hypothetical protein
VLECCWALASTLESAKRFCSVWMFALTAIPDLLAVDLCSRRYYDMQLSGDVSVLSFRT